MNPINILIVCSSREQIDDLLKKNTAALDKLIIRAVSLPMARIETRFFTLQFILEKVFECSLCGQQVDAVINLSDIESDRFLDSVIPALISARC